MDSIVWHRFICRWFNWRLNALVLSFMLICSIPGHAQFNPLALFNKQKNTPAAAPSINERENTGNLTEQKAFCTAAHEVLLRDLQKVNSAYKTIQRELSPVPVNLVQALVEHEQAIQALYQAELELFLVVSKLFSNPDQAFAAVKNRLLQLSNEQRQKTGCHRQENIASAVTVVRQLLSEFKATPITFGAALFGRKDTIEPLPFSTYLAAAATEERLAFQRIAAEHSLATHQQQQQQRLQALRQPLFSRENISALQQRAPACFAGQAVNDAPHVGQIITEAINRAVPLDVYPIAAAAACSIGVTDINWVGYGNLALLKRQLVAASKEPRTPETLQWSMENLQALSVLANINRQQQQLSTLQLSPAERASRQQRLASLEQHVLQRYQQAQQRKPAAMANWQDMQQRLATFIQLIETGGLERLADDFRVTEGQRLAALRQAGAQWRQEFVPKVVPKEYRVPGANTPQYLLGLVAYSRFFEQQLQQLPQQLAALSTHGDIQMMSCALKTTLKQDIAQINGRCLSPGAATNLTTLYNEISTYKP